MKRFCLILLILSLLISASACQSDNDSSVTDESGNVIATTTTYKALGYSKEYDCFRDTEAAEETMINLAVYGKGTVIEEPWEVFENAVKYVHNVINPKIFFTILALCLFLLDIAARKFKWKWPHEIFFGKKKSKNKT